MKPEKTKWKFNLKHLAKKIFLIFMAVFTITAALGTGGIAYLITTTSLGNTLETRHIAQTSVIYDRTGEHVLYEIHGEENRKMISHEEIPRTIRIATIATEDDSFYKHIGIDPVAILRALKVNIENGSIRQGGSTITQQLARNAFLTREKTLQRKVMEAVYAIKIERKYTKDEILDAYLNEVPYGANAYGIETASQTFFAKPAKELTLDEAALLAALTKAPSFYSPYGEHRKELVQRQQKVIKRIGELELADQEEIEKALKTDTLEKIKPLSQPIHAPHFVFYVLEELEKAYGEKMIREGGLEIYTTLDWEKQQLGERVIKNNEALLKRYGAQNAALVAIDPRNGQILTMVGSKDYFDSKIDGQVNVTIRPRQPGSSFKPIVYAKAFEKGFQPETLVLDATTNFGPDGSGRDYIPQNYDGRSHGVLSMRQALAMSLNIPAVKTLREVGLDDAISMAHRLGITTLNDQNRYGLSLVIGGGEVTLLDETSAYSVFANDGKRNPADPILKITDSKGNIIRSNDPKNMPVLNPEIARKINSVLSDNNARTPTFGPNNSLFIPGRTVAAKTGTTQEFRDAWTVGYTPRLAVGVWAGNNDNSRMRPGADGSFVAAPIWNQFISQATKSHPNEQFIAYDKSNASYSPPVKYKPSRIKEKITYYRVSNGKKISEKKAKKLDPEKVRKKVEIVYEDGDGDESKSSGRPVF